MEEYLNIYHNYKEHYGPARPSKIISNFTVTYFTDRATFENYLKIYRELLYEPTQPLKIILIFTVT